MEEQNKPQFNEPAQNSKIIWIIISVVITALVVGGGVYAWQSFNLKYTKQNLKQQITFLQNQVLLSKTDSNKTTKPDSDETSEIKINAPYCISNFDYSKTSNFNITEEELINKFFQLSPDHPSHIEALFSNNKFKELLNNTMVYAICDERYRYNADIVFVLYGEYNKFNNVIGIFDGEKLVLDYQNNPNSGDIGMCSIDGYIGYNIIYSCSGGDGPFAYQKIYLLNKKTEKSKIIKNCKSSMGVETCEVDLLNLGF